MSLLRVGFAWTLIVEVVSSAIEFADCLVLVVCSDGRFSLYRCLVDVPLWFHRFFVLWNSMRMVCLSFLLLTEILDGEMQVDGVFVTGFDKI